MRARTLIAASAAIGGLAVGATGAVASSDDRSSGTSAQGRSSFDGRILSVSRPNRTFRLRDAQRGTVRIRVLRGTRFERIAGFNGLRRGLVVEVVARRADGAWVAREVEISGRNRDRSRSEDRGRGGDDDSGRRGGDDSRRGSDDDGHGGRGRDHPEDD